jgi:hypothetical protein
MGNRFDLPSLEALSASILRERDECIVRATQCHRENAEQQLRKAVANRLAVQLLDAAGVELSHVSGQRCKIDLGYFKNTKDGGAALAAAVRNIREVLGCRLTRDDMDVDDAEKRIVVITLRPTDFPSVEVRFRRRLPRSAKCRIVRHRSSYTSIVCNV